MSRQWETWMTLGDEQDPHGHPLIVLSNDEACADANRASLNVLFGSTKRPAIASRPFEIVCDEADGFEKPTVIDCSRIYFIPKGKLARRLGTVSRTRRVQACRKLAEVFRFVFQ
ncbi:MAG: type II toxin-antitoxin system PemK/MazF family toxin [Opitutaceae bacterium]|nr:type II toxin-antitoxin system PemK/MazF family toxin [Opitutaceae bacterium]